MGEKLQKNCVQKLPQKVDANNKNDGGKIHTGTVAKGKVFADSPENRLGYGVYGADDGVKRTGVKPAQNTAREHDKNISGEQGVNYG